MTTATIAASPITAQPPLNRAWWAIKDTWVLCLAEHRPDCPGT